MKEEHIACVRAVGLRISTCENGKNIGHIELYVLRNEQGRLLGIIGEPTVGEGYSHSDVVPDLVRRAVESAKQNRCTKVLLTAPFEDPMRHLWFRDLNFTKQGFAFELSLP